MTTNSDDIWPPENVVDGPHGGHDAAFGIYEGIQWSDGQPFTCEDATFVGSAGEEFFTDLRVRQAFAHAFDKRSIIDEILIGESVENDGYNPVRHGPGGSQDIHGVTYEYDPGEALALLEEAGWVLGGEGPDAIAHFVHDPNGCQVFSGISISDGTLPITPGAPFPEFSGSIAGFVSRVCDDRLDFSTWVPGTGDVLLTDAAVDSFGQIYAGGFTSGGFPVTPNSPPFGAPGDAAFVAFNGPFIPEAGLVNSAGYSQFIPADTSTPRGLSPQEIVTGFGVFIGPEQSVGFRTDSAGNAFLNLGGAEVLTNGSRSTMISASRLQTSFVLDVDPPVDQLRPAPSTAKGAAPSTVTIQFEVDGDPSNTVTLPLVPSNPGLFALDSSGSGQGAILNPDFSVNGPGNPSRSFVIAFGTGGGDVEPDCPAATLAPGMEPLPRLQLPQRILVGGVDADFNYAGSAPGLVCGVNQWNVIPTNNPSGPAVPIQVCSGDACSNIVTAAFE